MTLQEMVTEFHRMFDCAVDDRSSDVIGFRMDLIEEEFNELWDELREALVSAFNEDRVDTLNLKYIAKEMADLVYVVYGAAVALGIDLDKAVQIVHQSNMSKVWHDGKPRVRLDGKILKPPSYQPPGMDDVVKDL